jgi:hypothetical protein
LYNGVNAGPAYEKYWLAPYVNSKKLSATSNLGRDFNQILVFFAAKTSISKISLWNYTKNTNRGVREVQILFDERFVFSVSDL